jgi:hypothetical protein
MAQAVLLAASTTKHCLKVRGMHRTGLAVPASCAAPTLSLSLFAAGAAASSRLAPWPHLRMSTGGCG